MRGPNTFTTAVMYFWPLQSNTGGGQRWCPPPKEGTQPQGTPMPTRSLHGDPPAGSRPAPTPPLPTSNSGATSLYLWGGGYQDPQSQGWGGDSTYHRSMVEPFFRLLLGYSSRQTRTPATLQGGGQGKGVLGARISPLGTTLTQKKRAVWGRKRVIWAQPGRRTMSPLHPCLPPQSGQGFPCRSAPGYPLHKDTWRTPRSTSP